MKNKVRLLFIIAVLSIVCVSINVKAVNYDSPTMQNPNIISVVHNDGHQCQTGEEETRVCVPEDVSKVHVGDFIKFKANSSVTKWFQVVEQTSDKLTLIARDAVSSYNSAYGYTATYVDVMDVVKKLQYTNANKTSKFNENSIATQGMNESWVSNFQSGSSVESYVRLFSAKYLYDAGCTAQAASGSSCPKYLYNVGNTDNCLLIMTNTNVNQGESVVTIRTDGAINITAQAHSTGIPQLCYKPVIEVNKYVANPYYNQNGSNNIVTYDNVKDAIEEGKITDSSGNTLGLDDVVVSANGQVLTKDGQPVYDKEGKTVFVKNDTVSVGDTLKIAYVGYIIGLLVLVIGAYVIYKSIKDSEVSIEE